MEEVASGNGTPRGSLGVPVETSSGALRPSLSKSHNSNEGKSSEAFTLNGSQRKTAYALEKNVARMFEEAGVERIGFLTLTVGNWKTCADAGCCGCHEGRLHFVQVFDPKEASRRINSLITGLLHELFSRAVIVTERHKSGAIHFHLIVECREDIRTGFDFVAFKAKRGYKKSASPALRRLWQLLLERLPGYGFGRAELSPIYKTGEAVSRYVAKYVEKNVLARRPEDEKKSSCATWAGMVRSCIRTISAGPHPALASGATGHARLLLCTASTRCMK